MDRQATYRLLRHQTETARKLIDIWGTGAIGPALVTRYYGPEPWVTAAALSGELTLSHSQTRRRLMMLHEEGKAERRDWEGVVQYSAEAGCAEEAADIIRSVAVHFA